MKMMVRAIVMALVLALAVPALAHDPDRHRNDNGLEIVGAAIIVAFIVVAAMNYPPRSRLAPVWAPLPPPRYFPSPPPKWWGGRNETANEDVLAGLEFDGIFPKSTNSLDVSNEK